jgi:hypothetical protein
MPFLLLNDGSGCLFVPVVGLDATNVVRLARAKGGHECLDLGAEDGPNGRRGALLSLGYFDRRPTVVAHELHGRSLHHQNQVDEQRILVLGQEALN